MTNQTETIQTPQTGEAYPEQVEAPNNQEEILVAGPVLDLMEETQEDSLTNPEEPKSQDETKPPESTPPDADLNQPPVYNSTAAIQEVIDTELNSEEKESLMAEIDSHYNSIHKIEVKASLAIDSLLRRFIKKTKIEGEDLEAIRNLQVKMSFETSGPKFQALCSTIVAAIQNKSLKLESRLSIIAQNVDNYLNDLG